MATLKQAEAVMAIYKHSGREISFEDASKMTQAEIDAVFEEAKANGMKSYDEEKAILDKQNEAINKPLVVETAKNVGIASIEPKMGIQPQAVIDHAQTAAKALTGVLERKPNKVMINGQQYIEYEDWQTLARFYGMTVGTAKVEEKWRADKLLGFTATAEVLQNGAKVSAAEADCLRDEPNWKTKPEFQLKSMAQTRACAKALRNVLGWVAVLAGYKPTPSEEMDGVGRKVIEKNIAKATLPQQRKIFAIAKQAGMEAEAMKEWVKERHGLESFTKLNIQQAKETIDALEKRLAEMQTEVVDPKSVKVK